MSFRFSLFSKSVGLMIYHVKFFKCPKFVYSLIYGVMVDRIGRGSIAFSWHNRKLLGRMSLVNLVRKPLWRWSNLLNLSPRLPHILFSQDWISLMFMMLNCVIMFVGNQRTRRLLRV
jgi:hypothetical protein